MTDKEDKNRSSDSPSSLVNQVIVSSRYPHTTDQTNHSNVRSPNSSNSSNSRRRATLNGRSSIQMEPGLQYLLTAEDRAAELIALARIKRNELIRQANQESQIETEVFRHERESQYQQKLQEATQLDQYQAKLEERKLYLLDQMEKSVQEQRKLLVSEIVHYVIDDIPIRPRPNLKQMTF